jgi:hypothetical protein
MTASGLVFVYVPLTRCGELIEFNCIEGGIKRERSREGGGERGVGEEENRREKIR